MADERTTFFNPWEEVRKTENQLPHWQQPGRTYFVTFRLADSVPTHLRERLEEERKNWLTVNPEPWTTRQEEEFHERFSGAIERWLDAGHGSCFLRKPEASRVVADALRHFDQSRYIHHAWVVMPNHVHALATLQDEQTLEGVLHSWKSYTSHELQKRFCDAPKPFWQRDYFDRLIRDSQHFGNCVRYIRRNPSKAHLRTEAFRLYESSLAELFA